MKFSPNAVCSAESMRRIPAMPGIKLWNSFRQIAEYHGSKTAVNNVRKKATAAGLTINERGRCNLPDGKWLEFGDTYVMYLGPKKQAAFTVPYYD